MVAGVTDVHPHFLLRRLREELFRSREQSGEQLGRNAMSGDIQEAVAPGRGLQRSYRRGNRLARVGKQRTDVHDRYAGARPIHFAPVPFISPSLAVISQCRTT